MYEYYRSIYPTITKDDINDFEKKYRKLKDEEEDLMDYYLENDGDLTNILEWVPLSTNEDISRYLEFYENSIKSKNLKKTKLYTKTKNNIKLINDENEEAEEEKVKMSDLTNQIMKNKTNRENCLNNLGKN